MGSSARSAGCSTMKTSNKMKLGIVSRLLVGEFSPGAKVYTLVAPPSPLTVRCPRPEHHGASCSRWLFEIPGDGRAATIVEIPIYRGGHTAAYILLINSLRRVERDCWQSCGGELKLYIVVVFTVEELIREWLMPDL